MRTSGSGGLNIIAAPPKWTRSSLSRLIATSARTGKPISLAFMEAILKTHRWINASAAIRIAFLQTALSDLLRSSSFYYARLIRGAAPIEREIEDAAKQFVGFRFSIGNGVRKWASPVHRYSALPQQAGGHS
jgi:hypothetical protein